MVKWLIAIIVVIVGGVIIFTYTGTRNEPSPSPTISATMTPTATPTASASPTVTVSPSVSPTTTKVTVTYTDTGYSPALVTIPVGGTVVFKNNSSGNMWTASAAHPTHKVYPGSDITLCGTQVLKPIFDECKAHSPGTTWEFTFTEKGEWGYHNHVKSSNFGKVIVK